MDSKLEKIKVFLLDMDGTIHISGELIKGAKDAIKRMRKRGRVIFLTNNSSLSKSDYIKKLFAMGISVSSDEVYTAGNATIDYIKENYSEKRIFLLGTENLKAEFCRNGINLVTIEPDLVVIAFDTSLTYANLSLACEFIRNDIPFIATHPDVNCPVKNGYIPDVGSFLALIKESTTLSPIDICGKPHKAIADGVKKLAGVEADEIMMVGDRLETDIKFANNNDLVSCLVLTGATSLEQSQMSDLKIDYVLNSIADLDLSED